MFSFVLIQVSRVRTNCGLSIGQHFYKVCKFFNDDVINMLPTEIDNQSMNEILQFLKEIGYLELVLYHSGRC